MEIKRDYYLNKLIEHKHNGFIKIVSGVRRCGKSYLLFELFKKHLLDNGVKENHIITIALIIIKRPKINEYIFNYKNKPIRDVKKAFIQAQKRAKVPYRSFHTLRHTTTTWLIANGIDVLAVQKILGHSNVAITMKYAHILDKSKIEALSSIKI